MTSLSPDQFLYHGTAIAVEGGRLLPAAVHGKGSYWGDAGKESRGEPADKYAWAHPDESTAWKFAHDRVLHTSLQTPDDEIERNPRARVYAVHQNEQQSPGHDSSIPGEVKAPHFDVAEQVDTMPGRQGTFPQINWNDHTTQMGLFGENEDANHPTNLSAQFGQRYARWGDHWNGPLREAARKEDTDRYFARLADRNIRPGYEPKPPELPLPGLVQPNHRLKPL